MNKCLPPFLTPTLACTAMPRRDDDSEGAGGDWCRSSEQVVTSEPTCRHCELLAGDWCAHCGLPPWSVDHPRPIAEGAKRLKIKKQDAGEEDDEEQKVMNAEFARRPERRRSRSREKVSLPRWWQEVNTSWRFCRVQVFNACGALASRFRHSVGRLRFAQLIFCSWYSLLC